MPAIFLVFLWLLFLAPSLRAQERATAEASKPLLTLEEAIRTATGGNRQLRISDLDIVKAKEKVAEARTYYLPQLNSFVQAGMPLAPINFTIPAGALGTYASTGPVPANDSRIHSPARISAFITASAGQPLTQLYKVHLAVLQGRLGVDLANQQVRAKKQDVVRQVREAYAQIVQTQAQVEAASAALKYLEELSALTDRRLAEKIVLLSDSLTVRAKVKQQKYQVLTLDDALEVQRQNLNRLLGRELRTSFSVDQQPLPENEELDLEAARRSAADRRPEIRQAQLQTKIAQMEVRRQKAEYIPDISAQVSYVSFQNFSLLPANVGHAGLAMKWQPFDWGYKHHRVLELRAASQQSTLAEKETTDQVLIEVEQTFRRLASARVLLDAQSATKQAEREKLRESTVRFEQRTLLLSDLLQQQNTVAQAEMQYQQALSGFWTAKAQFQKAVGED